MKAYLEPNEIKMMEDKTTNLRDRLLVRLLFRLGCRVSEALALKVEDIDFAQGTVTILTEGGREASDADWANPHLALYGRGWV